MNIIKKTVDGIVLTPIETQFFEDRVLFIEGEINDAVACKFQKELSELMKRKKEDILLVINSPGGSIQSGLSIYDAIWSVPFKVHTYCPSTAYSMGAVIFACGSGERVMSPHSKLMLHEPLVSGIKDGSLSNVGSVFKTLEQSRNMLMDILKKHTKMTENELTESFSMDHYYTYEESLKFGLCDKKGGVDYISSFGEKRITSL